MVKAIFGALGQNSLFVLIIFIQTYTYIGNTINHNNDYKDVYSMYNPGF